MGMLVNPGTNSFESILKKTYVDKTGLVDFVNSTIGSSNRMTCFSRPRRFGKSFAAKMLCAYYSRGYDSHDLFEGLEISRLDSFETYMNKFDVIYIDITMFISLTREAKKVVPRIEKEVIAELKEAYPDTIPEDTAELMAALITVNKKYGNQFFFIIDEWDALFREAKDDDAVQKEYVQLLRGLFKSGPATDASIAGAYMTGILPIKKYGTQSALTDFREYTFDRPIELAKYVGFTEDEVRSLCEESALDFEDLEKWYDGYSFSRVSHVYNPNSVMQAVESEELGSYWTRTETYESLKIYISMNFDGLKDAVVEMLGGMSVFVDVTSFANDFTTFRDRNDVLTLLIHLGYLSYDSRTEKARIPNLEISREFIRAVRGAGWSEVTRSLEDSERLIEATVAGDADAVAEALDISHETYSSIMKYNDENCLACAIHLAYYTARNYYKVIQEFPAGKGFADMVFLPRRDTDKPALVVELKYDQSADTAINQIKEKRYAGALSDYKGEILLVGVSYDRENKRHACVIEKYRTAF
ncbi:MAG: ATP-binding protein [Clostridiales bacterium]|nr:ATP-binding protein [Clostridiales bacterium]